MLTIRTCLALLLLATSLVDTVACNEQYAVPVTGQRCFEGWWCESWECRYCPECINYCACDRIVACYCNWQWLYLDSCWNQDCDSGGWGKAPARCGDGPLCRSSAAAEPQRVAGGKEVGK